MSLKVVKETELASPQAAQEAQQQRQPETRSNETKPEPTSASSSDPFQALAVLNEIRMILSARASVVMALIAAAILTFLAMDKGTGMALAISLSFDVGVFLPLAYIAFLRRRE